MRFKADFIIVMLKTNLKSNYPFQKYDMLECFNYPMKTVGLDWC
jgi:hypothetical protein